MSSKPKTLEERFYPKVAMSGGPDACWPWTGMIGTHGYGLFTATGQPRKRLRAHRVALALAGISVPPTKYVLHSCDNTRCCNPGHLRIGDAKSNAQDRVVRGRCGVSKLDTEKALAVRTAYAAGEKQVDIARRFGISQAHVSRTVTRRP